MKYSLLMSIFAASFSFGAIDSGGGIGTIGNFISHASVGSPFATSSKTASVIDTLYPIVSTPGGGTSPGGGTQKDSKNKNQSASSNKKLKDFNKKNTSRSSYKNSSVPKSNASKKTKKKKK
jgi:hypothetical protein